MTNDAELRELFSRKADEMQLRTGVPEGLSRRIKRRQLFQGSAAAAVIVGLIVGMSALGGSIFSEAEVPPVGQPQPRTQWSAPTVEGLAGVWKRDESSLVVQFREDGIAFLDGGGDIFQQPAVRAAYEISGDSILFTIEGSRICPIGDTWTWQTRLSDDRMEIVHTESGTGNCAEPIGTKWTLRRSS